MRHPETPPVTFDDHGQLRSNVANDGYFDRNNGLGESSYVFVEGNNLAERFAQCSRFSIGESGFGTGLNFLAALQCWRKHAPPSAQLRYVGIERYPLDGETIRRALSPFDDIHDLREEFLSQLRPPHAGWQYYSFENVELICIHTPIATALKQLDGGFDAWFLDGFAPSRDGEMWQPAILQHIAHLLKPGGTAATFTAAGQVRRDLQAAGLTVHKRSGFGRKREMLCAEQTTLIPPQDSTPWARHPATPQINPLPIIVAGGGIAGCVTARYLAETGHQVHLYDGNGLASGASGNPVGIVHPYLSASPCPREECSSVGLQQLRHWLQQAGDSVPHGWGPLEEFPQTDADQELFAKLAQQYQKTQHTDGRLQTPEACWLEPVALCQWLSNHPNITVIPEHIHNITKNGENNWNITSAIQATRKT